MTRKALLLSYLFAGLMVGCASVGPGVRRQNTSSLVNYLYPAGQPRPLTAELTNIKLPVRVGIAFVPSTHDSRRSNFFGGGYNNGIFDNNGLSTADQVKLMDEVAAHFRKYPYIKSVEVIPNNYLMDGGGFDNLDALASMYDVDIIGLVSYDQVQYTDEGAWSFLYLTIVGAFVIPAEKNTTTTFVDTAVFDVASRKLLFRAPGLDRRKTYDTLADNARELRDSSHAGFDGAFKDMIVNLDTALAGFKQKVKDNPDEYKVSRAPGYSGGGGGAGLWSILLLAVLMQIRVRIAHHTRSDGLQWSCKV
jgi:rhombotail lipoprotein